MCVKNPPCDLLFEDETRSRGTEHACISAHAKSVCVCVCVCVRTHKCVELDCVRVRCIASPLVSNLRGGDSERWGGADGG